MLHHTERSPLIDHISLLISDSDLTVCRDAEYNNVMFDKVVLHLWSVKSAAAEEEDDVFSPSLIGNADFFM